MSQQQGQTAFNQEIRNQLMLLLARSGLPKKLIDRCLHDVDGRPHYERVASINDIKARPPNSSYTGTACACCCNCKTGLLVEQGKLGKVNDNGEFVFLAPGYHTISTLGEEYLGEVSTAVYNEPVIHGSSGFVTITEGRIGVLLCGAEYRLLSPGTYYWNSPTVRFEKSVDVTTAVARLGPFSLVSVPSGMCSITYSNGDLRILGDDENTSPDGATHGAAAPSKAAFGGEVQPGTTANGTLQRTFFLDDPKWNHHSFITKKSQTDRLEGNDLLSKDNVEIIMTAFSNWRVCNPYLAVTECADDMEAIRTKVNSLVRATIARIVAGTNIGHNVTGVTSHDNAAEGQVVGEANNNNDHNNDGDLAHLMQSDSALGHMKELRTTLGKMGVEILGVYVPEKRMKNDGIREKIASQAVIGIKAESERVSSEASAFSLLVKARAEAEAINEVAKAHAEAGRLLGDPTSTAARLALSEVSAKALANSQVTIFSGAPDQMPFMFTQPPKK